MLTCRHVEGIEDLCPKKFLQEGRRVLYKDVSWWLRKTVLLLRGVLQYRNITYIRTDCLAQRIGGFGDGSTPIVIPPHWNRSSTDIVTK